MLVRIGQRVRRSVQESASSGCVSNDSVSSGAVSSEWTDMARNLSDEY